MLTYQEFQNNLCWLKNRIAITCAQCNRNPNEITILPVTKTFPIDAINYANQASLLAIGENKVQEAISKKELFSENTISWELIGHLQTNKAKTAVACFDRIQSVDSLKLAQKINETAHQQNKTMRILIQINAGNDPKKFGTHNDEALELMECILNLKQLQLEGVMTLAPLTEDKQIIRKAFESLRNLRDQLQNKFNHPLPTLSMGMSSDFNEAILEGSTLIRIGSLLFGKRTQLVPTL